MTKKEAITRMKEHIVIHRVEEPREIYISEALDMALEALEQEPCENCISREEFEKRIKPYDTEDDMDKALYNFAHNILICCPSVTPKPKTGHWKRVSMDRYTESAKYWYKCDKCGEINLGNTNFCPNCGRKMESEG